MDVQNLRNSAINGVFWLVIQSIFTKLIYFFITIWLARILIPADFGIVAICILVINIFNMLVDFGISSAIVQSKEENKILSVGFWLTIIFGICAVIITWLVSPLIAYFFNESSLIAYVRVMSIDVLLTALEVVPIAVLNKKLRFSKKVLPEIVFVFVFGGTAVSLAYAQHGPWSIIFGTLCAHFVRTCLYWFVTRPSIHLFLSKQLIANVLKYGYHVVGVSFLLMILLNGDNVIVRKILDNTALGFYALAYSIANLPATHITHVMGTVTFPLYSELQDDLFMFNHAFQKVLSLITVVSIPSAIGIIALAPLLISTLYGETWVPMIIPLQILCLFGMVRSILSVCGNIFYALNKHYILKRIMFAQLVMMIVFIYPLTKFWGLIGTAISINIAQLVAAVCIFLYISKLLKGNLINCLLPMFRTIIAAIVMGVFIYVVSLIQFPISNVSKLSSLVLSGSIIYLILIWMLNNSVAKECIKLIKSLMMRDLR